MRPLAGKTRDEVSISCPASLLWNPSPRGNLHIGTHSIPRFDSPIVKSSTHIYLQPYISTTACLPTPHVSARYNKCKRSTMGALYSLEIHAAIDQLTSLVAAVQTTKNIFIFLAAIQVIKVIILALILLAMLALLVTMNQDLEDERAAVVTPAVKWIIHRLWNVAPATHLQRDVELPRADTLQEKTPQVTRRRSSCESSQLS